MAAVSQRRTAVLRELGITPWRQREAVVPAGAEPAAKPASLARCVVLLPAGAGNSPEQTRAMDLLGRALNACGAGLARAGRVSVSEGRLSAPLPTAPVYLVFGQPQAQALGRELDAAALAVAHIALVDEPAKILREASAKRALWTALRQVRRAMAAAIG